ncbi:related to C.carbonum toxD protein [Ramularia collo-cygni]|uniref:Related to C.carbonum toxD protein n=1 Tax=Ramularia collo-cygni TaxID=112498 RepID=A0A2D3V1K2_9PEZI|nr:related to C.carbonum toxD protein [Ramularia collo-cygni]CZT21688.1 related to C.carbonum toxD protein [Ramularia collo-cygni]
MSPTPGATAGCDFSGDVVQLGEDVSDDTLSLGTKVCGCVFGNNPEFRDNGAFAEYVAVPSKFLLRIPDSMSYQSAATLGIGLSTVGLALYHGLGLESRPSAPSAKSHPVLVSGGGTATGSLAIQVLKLAGLEPVTTCSSGSVERLQRLGAVATFDYRSPTCGNDIREYTDNKLVFALDCQADMGSMAICYNAIGSSGGRYMALNPFPLRGHRRRSVRPDWVFMFTQFSQPITWKRPYRREPQLEDREFAEKWYVELQRMLERLEPVPYRERVGGLAAVMEGVESVGKGEVAGCKLVYRV